MKTEEERRLKKKMKTEGKRILKKKVKIEEERILKKREEERIKLLAYYVLCGLLIFDSLFIK